MKPPHLCIDIAAYGLALTNHPESLEPGIKPGSGYFQNSRHHTHRKVRLFRLPLVRTVPALLLDGIDGADFPKTRSESSIQRPDEDA